MSTVQITVPDEIKSLADKQIASGRFADLSDYVTNLIRQDQDRLEDKRLETLLRQRLASGPATPMTDADFDVIRSRLDAHRAQGHAK